MEHTVDTVTPLPIDCGVHEQILDDAHAGHRTLDTVPYGLYRGTISVNPYLAQDTGYSEEDNELFLSALVHMLDNDASAARANVAVRKVYVWTHEPDLGAAPNHRLFDSLDIRLKETVEFPRQFSDYNITVATPPEGVTLVELVDGLDV